MMSPFHYIAIPCRDLERASRFYHEVARLDVQVNPNAPFPMAYLVNREGAYPGHLFASDPFPPGREGPLVYLKVDADLNDTLARVQAAGGQVIMPKREIAPGKGCWAVFLDSEGNRLALHSDR